MTALYIIGGILLLLIFLLLSTVKIRITYTNQLTIRIHYLFLNFPLFPKDRKIRKKAKHTVKKEAAKQENKLREMIREHGYVETFKIIKQYVSPTVNNFKKFAKHIVIKPFNFNLVMVSEDAADLAIQYGAFCAVFYTTFSYLQTLVNFKNVHTNINVNYIKKDYELDFDTFIRFRLIFGLVSLIKIISDFIKIRDNSNERNVIK